MQREMPITRVMAREALAAIEAAMESETEEARFEVWGQSRTIRRQPQGWFSVEVPGEATANQIFRRSFERPGGYPLHLPFLKNEVASISINRATMVVWLAPEDPDSALTDVVEQSIRDGWTASQTEASGVEGHERVELRKGERSRMIGLSEGTVSVIDLGP